VDQVALLKNIGVTNAKTIPYFHSSELQSRLYHAKEALSYLISAKEHAQLYRTRCPEHFEVPWDPNWFNRVNEHIQSTLDEAIRSCSDLTPSISRLDKLLPLMEVVQRDPRFAAELLVQLATIVFNTATRFSSSEEFDRAEQVLESNNRFFVEALTFSKKARELEPHFENSQQLVVEAEDLFERRFILLCVCRSVRTRIMADHEFDRLIDDTDEFAFEMIWQVIDLLREAILLTREKDIEHEALCLSRLGKIFDKVVKLRDKAKECYKKAIELALSLTPRNMAGVDWYDEVLSAYQKMQQEDTLRQDEAMNRGRQAYLTKYRDVLAKIDQASTNGAMKLLEHIYVAHPPRNKDHRLSETPSANNLKNLLRKAVCHYHPDKHVNDLEWQFLCQEIVKRLNTHYTLFKGV